MLTLEQIQSIIDSRIALIKPYYLNGEIKRNDGKSDWRNGNFTRKTSTPWPEFWPGYNEAVKERDELAVHIQYGVFPEHLVRSRSPNQSDAEYKYVKDNFQPITLAAYVDAENTIRRALHESNWRLEFTDEGFDFSEYVHDHIGELGSLTAWAKFLVPKMKALDPMGVICVMPESIPTAEGVNDDGEAILVIDPDELITPQPIYFPVDRVWGYEPGKWYALLTLEKSVVQKGGKDVEEGLVLWIVDDTNCWKATQVGQAHRLAFEVSLYFQHDQGYPPCTFLMGTPKLHDGRVVHQSFYLPAKPAFDTVLLDNTYLQMVKSNSAYPYRVMLGSDCSYVSNEMSRCVGGDMMGVDEEGHQIIGGKCPSCKGTGIAAKLGPNGVLFVLERKRADGTPTSVHDAMTFVEPTATTLDFLRREITDQMNAGRKMLHLSSEQPMQGGDQRTATESGIGVKAQMAFIKPISDQIFHLMDFVLDSMALQRYGVNGEELYHVVPATTFDLRTEADYLAEYGESLALPPSLRQSVLEGYIHTRYSSDPAMLEAFSAIIFADRLFAVSWDEIAAMTDKKPWEVALHNEALSIYERLSRDNKFANSDRFEQAEAMQAEAQRMYPEKSTAPIDIAQRLIENINPPAIEPVP